MIKGKQDIEALLRVMNPQSLLNLPSYPAVWTQPHHEDKMATINSAQVASTVFAL